MGQQQQRSSNGMKQSINEDDTSIPDEWFGLIACINEYTIKRSFLL